MQSTPIFSTRLGMIETRLALPQRSPNPFIVPCTCPTPSATAASELATAHSASLWTWMPSGVFTCFVTTWRTATRSGGSVPPFVSHSTSQWAPAASADRRVASAYSRFRRKPSKKCSASNITSSIRGRRKAIVSAIIFKFSSSVVESAWVTWKSHDLPTIVATGAPASSSACMVASDSAGECQESAGIRTGAWVRSSDDAKLAQARELRFPEARERPEHRVGVLAEDGRRQPHPARRRVEADRHAEDPHAACAGMRERHDHGARLEVLTLAHLGDALDPPGGNARALEALEPLLHGVGAEDPVEQWDERVAVLDALGLGIVARILRELGAVESGAALRPQGVVGHAERQVRVGRLEHLVE